MSVSKYPRTTNANPKLALKQLTINRFVAKADPNKQIKLGIWAYFVLLIIEGALRKWVLPGLSTPLLIIRDPIAAYILILAWSKELIVFDKYLVGMVIIGIVGVGAAMLVGHQNLPVALFGARILVLHFPLIFVIGRVFNRDDVIKMGKFILLISIPMALLIAVQFYSPQSAFVNASVGGDEKGAGFSGALGFFRPPGTFSFTNGTTLFFGLVSGLVIYFWLNAKTINRLVLIGATLALLASIPLSISRSLLFQVVLSVVFALLATSRKPKYLGRMLMAIVGAVAALAILSTTSFFQTAAQAFTNRFESANEIEGGLEGVFIDRYLGGLIGALQQSSEEPFLGYGIGMGTNVGSMLLSGKVTYLIAEGEWGRLIGELGPLLGIAVIAIRMGLAFKLLIFSYKKLVLGDLLPWMLLGFFLTNVPQGQWAQPTSLGFSILIGGLLMASLRVPKKSPVRVPVRTPLTPMKTVV
ncbi:MAG: hypothetical protein ABIN94_00570 [Ferruginibacter sp.]